jgi:hypothetical protein
MRRRIIISLSVVLAVLVVFVGISPCMGYTLSRVERIPLTENPSFMGPAYEDVAFRPRDKDLTLRGWLLPGNASYPVISMVHGNGYSRDDSTIGTLDIAAGLVQSGSNVAATRSRTAAGSAAATWKNATWKG